MITYDIAGMAYKSERILIKRTDMLYRYIKFTGDAFTPRLVFAVINEKHVKHPGKRADMINPWADYVVFSIRNRAGKEDGVHVIVMGFEI